MHIAPGPASRETQTPLYRSRERESRLAPMRTALQLMRGNNKKKDGASIYLRDMRGLMRPMMDRERAGLQG